MCVYVCVCCVHINVSKTVSAYQFLVFVILLISWVLFSQHCYSWKTLRLQLQTDKNISNQCVGLKHDNLPDLLKLINGNWMDIKLKKRHHAVFFPLPFSGWCRDHCSHCWEEKEVHLPPHLTIGVITQCHLWPIFIPFLMYCLESQQLIKAIHLHSL